ncbi:MAG: IclR family transcriptional regulator [Actinomycetia bacterium]|nr:IclR family transcriptional regulator [Actinomycetes bacterium]MCP4222361.1 IclR family transcriptional regulator [Actinomycetes bacterium]MCP5032714.1 IclR family transcriptional regulator [Actinomycetes bacterium]
MTFVQSVERSFELLEAVAGGPAGISELARRVELPTSTVARLLKTMEKVRVVERDTSGVYRLGSATLALASKARLPGDIAALDRSDLSQLSARLGEVVGLSAQSGSEVLYLTQVDSQDEVQIRDWTGDRLPLHVVSPGLVFLASAPQAEVDAYLDGDLKRYTNRTVTDPDAIKVRLAEIRQAGYAWTKGEFHPGVNSVAAPLFDDTGTLVGALHSHGPSYRFPPVGHDDPVAAALTHAAARMSRQLGWTGDLAPSNR